MIWVRRIHVLVAFAVVLAVGLVYTLRQPRQYSAEALIVLDARPDLVLGGLGTAASMATQVEIIKTEKTALRAVQILGLADDPAAIARWKAATGGQGSIEHFLAAGLQRGLTVDTVRNSNVISLTYATSEKGTAVAAANAFAQAAVDVALEMRVGPAKESAEWFNTQTATLRQNLEQAQAQLSRFQQENNIVFSDDKFTLETARLSALEQQLIAAQSERIEAAGRARASSPDGGDAARSALAQGLVTQLAAAEAKLAEVSNVLGSGHPQRVQLEAQIASLKQQLAVETARVNVGSATNSRISASKVEELRQLVEDQKRQVLAHRSVRDRMAVLVRDVETAQRAYEGASQRASQLTLEARANQAVVRMLNSAADEADVSRRKLMSGLVATLALALAAGAGLAIALELLDRRVRSIEDLTVDAVVPLLGVVRPNGSKKPVFRPLPVEGPIARQPLLPMSRNTP